LAPSRWPLIGQSVDSSQRPTDNWRRPNKRAAPNLHIAPPNETKQNRTNQSKLIQTGRQLAARAPLLVCGSSAAAKPPQQAANTRAKRTGSARSYLGPAEAARNSITGGQGASMRQRRHPFARTFQRTSLRHFRPARRR